MVLSNRRRRIAAFFIDHFIITSVIVSAVLIAMGPNFLEKENMDSVPLKILSVLAAGFILYLSKDGIHGISPGKWVMGIMIRDAINPDKIPSFGRLLLRNLLLIIWPVEFLVMSISGDKKRLGDKVAKTIVFENPDKPNKNPRILALLVIGISFFASALFITGTTIKKSEAYQVAIREIEKNDEIKTETGGIKGYGIIPTGNITIVNGKGKARFEIKVLGHEQNISVTVHLKKEIDDNWKLSGIQK